MACKNLNNYFSVMKKRRRRIFSKLGFWPTILHGTRYEGLLPKRLYKYLKAVNALDEIISRQELVNTHNLTSENYKQVVAKLLNKRQEAVWGGNDPQIFCFDMDEGRTSQFHPSVPRLQRELIPFVREYEYYLKTSSYKCE